MAGALRALVGIVAVVLISAGVYFFFHTQSAVPAYTPLSSEPPGKGISGNAKLDQDPYDVLVTYTDQGFSPADLTIAQGQRVRFLNNSTQSFWPASGVHPTHSLYPEKESGDCLGSAFDACQDLRPGEYYDFTFNYIGDWPYHDHIHAYNTGSITVKTK